MRRREFLAGAVAGLVLARRLCAAPAAAYDGPLFDAHTHASEQGSPTPPELVEVLKKAGVSGVAFMGPRGFSMDPSLQLQKQFPDFVAPFAQVPVGPAARGADGEDRAIAFLEQQIAAGVFRGIGEVPLRHRAIPGVAAGNEIPADGPFAARIYAAGAKYKLPVNVHVEGEYADVID